MLITLRLVDYRNNDLATHINLVSRFLSFSFINVSMIYALEMFNLFELSIFSAEKRILDMFIKCLMSFEQLTINLNTVFTCRYIYPLMRRAFIISI